MHALANLIAKAQSTWPVVTLTAVGLVIAIAAAILLGIIVDEWLQFRAARKDVIQRKEQIEKLIAMQNAAELTVTEQEKEQKKLTKSLWKWLSVSGSFWHKC